MPLWRLQNTYLTYVRFPEIFSFKVYQSNYITALQQENVARSFVGGLVRSYEHRTRPVTRSQAKAAAEKHSPTPPPKTDEDIWKLTPIDFLLVDGMNDDQVWAQLELRTANICETLKDILDGESIADENEGVDIDAEGEDDDDDDDDGEIDYDDEEDEVGLDGFDNGEGDEDIGSDEEDEDENEKGFPEEITNLRDPSDEESADEGTDEEEDGLGDGDVGMDLDKSSFSSKFKSNSTTILSPELKRTKGHPILDDGFFSLAEFNAEVERAEAKRVSRGQLNDEDDEDEDLESDIDLFAPVDETNFDEEDLDSGLFRFFRDWNYTLCFALGEAYYDDFFAPPKHLKDNGKPNSKKKVLIAKPKKPSLVRFNDEVKVRKIKSTGKGISLKALNLATLDDGDDDVEYEEYDDDENSSEGDEDEDEDEDEDYEESETGEDEGRDAIERFKDDLFADDEEEGLLKGAFYFLLFSLFLTLMSQICRVMKLVRLKSLPK